MARHAARYAGVARLMPRAEWDDHYESIAAIEALKYERDAIVLAHNYQRSEILHGVADFHGDSLALAREAASANVAVVVVCGVRFMAEAAKLLAPDKTVLLPDSEAGCSLADSITADQVRALRARYPGVPVVCHVNTTAAVRAECDSCCTSENAIQVVESFRAPMVILVPDQDLAVHVAARTKVQIVAWSGCCEARRAAQIEFVQPRNPCPHMRRTTLASVRASLESMTPVIRIPDGIADAARRATWRMLRVGLRAVHDTRGH